MDEFDSVKCLDKVFKLGVYVYLVILTELYNGLDAPLVLLLFAEDVQLHGPVNQGFEAIKGIVTLQDFP
jgi:hypothetical protein